MRIREQKKKRKVYVLLRIDGSQNSIGRSNARIDSDSNMLTQLQLFGSSA